MEERKWTYRAGGIFIHVIDYSGFQLPGVKFYYVHKKFSWSGAFLRFFLHIPALYN